MMAFNARDPYDAAALYDMWLNCQNCPETFDFEPTRPIGLDYYHDIGQQAKRDGWVVVEQEDPDDVEGVSYLVLCPCCASRYGLTVEHATASADAPRVIREICDALEQVGEERAA